jgi:hypothetical protein
MNVPFSAARQRRFGRNFDVGDEVLAAAFVPFGR